MIRSVFIMRCDKCPTEIDTPTLQELFVMARRVGWQVRLRDDGEDLCSAHKAAKDGLI